jgi:adenylate kinase
LELPRDLRDHIRRETEIGIKAKDFLDQGKLVPDSLVFEMLAQRMT